MTLRPIISSTRSRLIRSGEPDDRRERWYEGDLERVPFERSLSRSLRELRCRSGLRDRERYFEEPPSRRLSRGDLDLDRCFRLRCRSRSSRSRGLLLRRRDLELLPTGDRLRDRFRSECRPIANSALLHGSGRKEGEQKTVDYPICKLETTEKCRHECFSSQYSIASDGPKQPKRHTTDL